MSEQARKAALDAEARTVPIAEPLAEKIARLEAYNARLKARAEDAERAFADLLTRQHHEGRPEQRSTHDVLAAQETTLEAILAELRRANSAAREGAVSSILIEDNPTKDRVVRVTTKHYSGSVLDVDEALEIHAHAHREAERRALDGWAETVDGLAEAKSA
jgi:hypothetical protein